MSHDTDASHPQNPGGREVPVCLDRNGKLHDSLPCCWRGHGLPTSDLLGTDSGLAPPYSTPLHPVPLSRHGPSENRISNIIKMNLYSEVLLRYELNKSRTSVAMQTDTIFQCSQMLLHRHLTSTTALRLSKTQQEKPSPFAPIPGHNCLGTVNGICERQWQAASERMEVSLPQPRK